MPSDYFTTTQKVLQAAEAANAREFIDRLPEGYDTLVGGTGVGIDVEGRG
jgi:ABC-type protease/lipase transport system fused ATPase/permease subunit